LYASSNITRVLKSRRMRWVVHVGRIGDMGHGYSILVGKPEGKRPFRRSRHRWEGYIRMAVTEVVWESDD
jgi:hypothetical protein